MTEKQTTPKNLAAAREAIERLKAQKAAKTKLETSPLIDAPAGLGAAPVVSEPISTQTPAPIAQSPTSTPVPSLVAIAESEEYKTLKAENEGLVKTNVQLKRELEASESNESNALDELKDERAKNQKLKSALAVVPVAPVPVAPVQVAVEESVEYKTLGAKNKKHMEHIQELVKDKIQLNSRVQELERELGSLKSDLENASNNANLSGPSSRSSS